MVAYCNMPLVKVAQLADVPPGKMKEVEVGTQPIALCNNNGNICAIDGTCPHSGGPIASGALHGNVAICPWHSWGFNIETGVSDFSANISIPVFRVEVHDGEIFVDVA